MVPLLNIVISPPGDILATEVFDDEYVILTPCGLFKEGKELPSLMVANHSADDQDKVTGIFFTDSLYETTLDE